MDPLALLRASLEPLHGPEVRLFFMSRWGIMSVHHGDAEVDPEQRVTLYRGTAVECVVKRMIRAGFAGGFIEFNCYRGGIAATERGLQRLAASLAWHYAHQRYVEQLWALVLFRERGIDGTIAELVAFTWL